MTLAYSALPAPTLRLVGPPGRKRRAWRQPSRSTRVAIGPGRPRSLSWSQLRWEDDDWAWYAVEHSGPLEHWQIGELLGVTEGAVRLVEESALAKLSELDPATTGVQLGRLFAEWDRERHAERRGRERAARVEVLLRELAREGAQAVQVELAGAAE